VADRRSEANPEDGAIPNAFQRLARATDPNRIDLPVDNPAVFVANYRQRQTHGGAQQQPFTRRAQVELARVNLGEGGKGAAGAEVHPGHAKDLACPLG
jgi:hypothetical protein